MRLWDWAVQAYAAAGVEQLCLELQDLDGQCVCLLLWAAWTADAGRVVGVDDVGRAAEMARTWTERAIAPLRAARRGLKPASPGVDDDGREALRSKVKAAELDAERLLLDALDAATPMDRGGPRDLTLALRDAARAWNGSDPDRLSALAAAVAQV